MFDITWLGYQSPCGSPRTSLHLHNIMTLCYLVTVHNYVRKFGHFIEIIPVQRGYFMDFFWWGLLKQGCKKMPQIWVLKEKLDRFPCVPALYHFPTAGSGPHLWSLAFEFLNLLIIVTVWWVMRWVWGQSNWVMLNHPTWFHNSRSDSVWLRWPGICIRDKQNLTVWFNCLAVLIAR